MLDKNISLSITQDGDPLYAKARKDGIETVWERHDAQQPQCGFCDMGLSCRICVMGPCRVDPFGEGPQTGVCGADADIIVARNLCRMIAAGAASHSDHGRDLVEVLAAWPTATAHRLQDPRRGKTQTGAGEYGLDTADKQPTGRCRRTGPRHDGRLRHAPQEDPTWPPVRPRSASRCGKRWASCPAGHRPRDLGDDAPHPHGRGQQLAEPACCRGCAMPCPTAGAGP